MAVIGTDLGLLSPLIGNQAQASDPKAHVWLSASAGTGKTHVLSARVFRLLLRGVDPAAILCLTFTKAGAAEMAARISARLAGWVRMPEADLKKDLHALGEAHLDAAVRQRARTLFARVLDAPGGGLRIQTIHSFCQSLLAAFPIEAGLVPGFRPLEAREEAQLARETLAELLADAEREGREATIAAVGKLSLRLGEGGAEGFLLACARAVEAMDALPAGDGVRPFVRRALGLPSEDVELALASRCGNDAFDLAALRRIAQANRAWGTATGAGAADIADRWIAAPPAERVAMLKELVSIVHTQKGEPKKFSTKLIDAEPDYEALARALGSCCAELIGMVSRAAFADLLADGLGVGRDYAAAYRAAKRRAGAVDFDDLIRATVALLRQPGMGDWVRYKLDQATDHVLIDEAQDTNEDQWSIVKALADEFFAGEGAHGDALRTIFTVGDYKQAIFGFQGTDPVEFARAERYFLGLAEDAEADFRTLSLTHSFRSTKPILEFVDAALDAVPEPRLGGFVTLKAHASEVPGPGLVELWPPTLPDEGADESEEGWIDDATLSLAKKIAREIKGWLVTNAPLEAKGRPIRPEDVMILVRRRGELASLLVARLHAEGVPVAGVDRLRLNAPLAVQDLLAAIRFVLQPEDDLSLASLLVSPLIGWSQDDLMVAAVARPPGSLWRHLQRTLPEERLAPLRAMLNAADFTPPYRFLEDILSGPLAGRRRLLARLGEEARDPIEELLNAALDFEANATPSLQAFLDWFDRGDVEIVRDPSAPLDAVRVMTVHGAKGLQAPIVILADATGDPAAAPRGVIGWKVDADTPPIPIIRPRADERGGPLAEVVANAERRELEEHWRLFYVAATRAEERLVIAGALGPRAKGEPPATSWYAVAERAMATLAADERGGVLRFAGSSPQKPAKPNAAARREEPAAAPLPGWASQPAPQESRPPRPLAPSSLGEDEVADPPPSAAMRAAAERGRLLHALFERLPNVTGNRRAAAERWLATAGGVEDGGSRAEIAAAALKVIEDSRLADLFGPDALAEAPIAAVIAGGRVVAGTVDRLVVTDERIRVVDFKTGRQAPASLEAIPAYHLRQMAAYRDALAAIFPGRAIEAALLYTAGPALFVLPDELLDRHSPGA